jgi:hypothetical protein
VLCVPAAIRHDPLPDAPASARIIPGCSDGTQAGANTIIVPARLVPAAVSGLAGHSSLQPAFLLWPTGQESWRPYTLLSYTGDDLLYIRLPGPPVRGTPPSADHRARWAADLSARHRAHGGQLNNHSCWMRNLLPGLEARGSHREPGRVGQPGRDVEVVRDPLELGVQHPHQARDGRRLAARDLLDRVGGAHRAAPRSWPGGPSESSMSMPPTQMSLTRGRGHQLGFHRAVMASLIAKRSSWPTRFAPATGPRPDRPQRQPSAHVDGGVTMMPSAAG